MINMLILLSALLLSPAALAQDDAAELSSSIIRRPSKSDTKLDYFVFHGFPPEPHRLFTSVEITLNISNDYELYRAENRTVLDEQYEQNTKFFGLFRGFVIWKSKQLAPFEKALIGVETQLPYAITIKIWHLDYVRLGVVCAGFLLFIFAQRLARNALFYYTSGCSIGVLASMLIVVWMLYKVLPRRSVALSVLVGGWSFSGYVLYSVWQNFYLLLMQYQKWVAVYVVTVMVLSFGFCYYMGPPREARTQNLSQWALQLVGLLLIYGACQIPNISLAAIIALLTIYNTPEAVWRFITRLGYRFFPAKPSLLTEDEYHQQGVEHTRKALEELRSFCSSPKCEPWKLVSKLDSPMRFSQFVEGASHLSDQELLQYDINDDDDISSDSSDDNDEGEEENTNNRVMSTSQTSRIQYRSFVAPPRKQTQRLRRSMHEGASSSNGVRWAASQPDISDDD